MTCEYGGYQNQSPCHEEATHEVKWILDYDPEIVKSYTTCVCAEHLEVLRATVDVTEVIPLDNENDYVGQRDEGDFCDVPYDD